MKTRVKPLKTTLLKLIKTLLKPGLGGRPEIAHLWGSGPWGHDGRSQEEAMRQATKKLSKQVDLGFVIHGFGAGRKSTNFGVWAAPAAPQTLPQGGVLRPPSGMVFGAAGAAQTPNIDDFRPAQKPCMKNPSVDMTSRVNEGLATASPR